MRLYQVLLHIHVPIKDRRLQRQYQIIYMHQSVYTTLNIRLNQDRTLFIINTNVQTFSHYTAFSIGPVLRRMVFLCVQLSEPTGTQQHGQKHCSLPSSYTYMQHCAIFILSTCTNVSGVFMRQINITAFIHYRSIRAVTFREPFNMLNNPRLGSVLLLY